MEISNSALENGKQYRRALKIHQKSQVPGSSTQKCYQVVGSSTDSGGKSPGGQTAGANYAPGAPPVARVFELFGYFGKQRTCRIKIGLLNLSKINFYPLGWACS